MSNSSTGSAQQFLQRLQEDEAFRLRCEAAGGEGLRALIESEGYRFSKEEMLAALGPYLREEELLSEDDMEGIAGGGPMPHKRTPPEEQSAFVRFFKASWDSLF